MICEKDTHLGNREVNVSSVIARWSTLTACTAMLVLGFVTAGRADVPSLPSLPAVISTEEAYNSWLPLALKGSPSCQYNIGLLYLYGIGKPRDRKASLGRPTPEKSSKP